MKRLSVSTIAQQIGGVIIQGSENLLVNNFAYHIKKVKQCTVYFDLLHEKTAASGYYFKNTLCAVVTDELERFVRCGENVTIIYVKDIDKAYWKLIDAYRVMFTIPVIGVTGTCGKTTTKEMIRHILEEKYKVNATYKSFNAEFRHLGYLLKIDEDTQAAVYEMGVASPGNLKVSCRYFKPQVGVITNIGVDHLHGFGTIEAYIKGKVEFLEGLENKGTIILNADDENIKNIDLSKYQGEVIYFGKDERSHFKILDINYGENGTEFKLKYKDTIYNFSVPGYGEFNVYNAVAAIAASYAIGFSIVKAGERLKSFRHVERHFELKKGINGSTVFDDTWSTNPTSAEAALKLLKSLSQGKKTIAALGKMSLLGKQGSVYHFNVGKKLADIGIDFLVLIGSEAKEIGLGAMQNGMKSEFVFFCQDINEASHVLSKILDSNSVALVKTSMMTSNADIIKKITIK